MPRTLLVLLALSKQNPVARTVRHSKGSRLRDPLRPAHSTPNGSRPQKFPRPRSGNLHLMAFGVSESVCLLSAIHSKQRQPRRDGDDVILTGYKAWPRFRETAASGNHLVLCSWSMMGGSKGPYQAYFRPRRQGFYNAPKLQSSETITSLWLRYCRCETFLQTSFGPSFTGAPSVQGQGLRLRFRGYVVGPISTRRFLHRRQRTTCMRSKLYLCPRPFYRYSAIFHEGFSLQHRASSP